MSSHPRATSEQEGPKPTPAQQRLIRQLALERGISFTPPHTRAEASRLVDALKRRRPDARADRQRDRRVVQDALATGGDAARVRDDEVTGYGSSATWKEVRS